MRGDSRLPGRRDLVMDHPDVRKRLWAAHGDDTAGISLHAARGGQKPGSRAQQLMAWAQSNPELLCRVQQHVHCFVSY